MTARSSVLALGALGLLCAAPASATLRVYRAVGTVLGANGDVSLLPLAAEPGDDFTIEFSYDDAAADLVPAIPEIGGYPVLTYAVTVAGTTVDYATALEGEAFVNIQLSGTFDLWGVSACPVTCASEDYDEARLNFYFDADTFASDALVPPPGPIGAENVQFGLFSSRQDPASEASVDATLESLTLVPEPGAALSLAAGALVLGAARSAGRRARALR